MSEKKKTKNNTQTGSANSAEKTGFFNTYLGFFVKVGLIVIVCAILIGGFLLYEVGFRAVIVKETRGIVTVEGEKNKGDAYVGERLQAGDDVDVNDASGLTLCLDSDKFVYAENKTHLKLKTALLSRGSRIKIYIDDGSELNVLKNKLDKYDSYEVDTPNATMSVRGTVFRVSVYREDGYVYTLLEVLEGVVHVHLKTTLDEYSDVERDFEAGSRVLMRAREDISEFVTIEENVSYSSDPYYTGAPIGGATGSSNDDTDGGNSTSSSASNTGAGTPEGDTADNGTEDDDHIHSFSDWREVSGASCESGNTEVRTCSVCGYTESRSTKPALGHNWEYREDLSDPGNAREYYECTRCHAEKPYP